MCSQQYLVVREWCEALWIRGYKNIILEESCHCSGHEHAAAIPLPQIQTLYRGTDNESQHRLQDARISSVGSELTLKAILVATCPHSLHPFLPPTVQSESLSIACTVKPPLSSEIYKKRPPHLFHTSPDSSPWILAVVSVSRAGAWTLNSAHSLFFFLSFLLSMVLITLLLNSLTQQSVSIPSSKTFQTSAMKHISIQHKRNLSMLAIFRQIKK